MEKVNGASDQRTWFPKISEIKAQLNNPLYDVIFDPPYNEVSQITDNIYITSLGGLTKENFDIYQFKCIFDFCEGNHYNPEGIEYQKMLLLDHVEQSIYGMFNAVTEKLYENDLKGKKTVVHCYGGASRSAAMVIAYLMKYRRLSLHEAFNYLRNRRLATYPNTGFLRQLIDYELKLFGKSSVKIIKVRNEAKKLATELPDFYEREHKDLVDMEFWYIERGIMPERFRSLPYD